MAQKIPYTHFFDLLHKLLIIFAPIGSIIGISYLTTEYDIPEYLVIIMCISIILMIVLYAIFLRAIPTFLYVFFKFNVKLNYKQMNYCHPLFSGSKWYPCDDILSLPKEHRKEALIKIAKEIFHKYDNKDYPIL